MIKDIRLKASQIVFFKQLEINYERSQRTL